MPVRLRVTLLATTTAVVLAFALLVLLDGPAGRSRALPSSTSFASSAGAPTNSGFDGAALPANVRAHGFTLSDQFGRRISLEQYRGQVVVLAFLASSCGPCTVIAQQVRGALDELAHPPAVLVVSIDPRADTPPRVSRFLSQVSLSLRAHYLTGPAPGLHELRRSYGAAPASSARAITDGAAAVFLIDTSGFERVAFGIEQLTPESLAHDIRRLQSEP
jgi:cytochrome oxidase Cu insertion factor (SCO1/SenC/PrrC family)